ncbi:hypothetical protein Ga0451573_002324 [Peptococcaceae bacterium DYL19]|nr:hypothetical protein [Phosphitispora fastidiosa]
MSGLFSLPKKMCYDINIDIIMDGKNNRSASKNDR